jgi:antitoxin VapB
MSLNIKNAEAHAMAAELAKLTGESITAAVTEAIRQRLAYERKRRNRERLIADLLAIGERCAAYPRTDTRSIDDFLYDDDGMPA